MYFQRLFPSSPVKSSNSPPSNRSTAPKSTPLENNTSMSSDSQGGILNCTTHVDIDSLIEEYVWQRFKDLLTIKGSGLETFKNLEIGDAEFEINRKKLFLVHSQPNYNNIQLTGTRPNTIFKSLFTNNTSQMQCYSLKTERTSESICGVAREQGFTFGAEAELSLKIPGEIAELKTGFKHEVHFNKLTENIKSETLTWAVDNNIQVPAGGQTEASIIIEEMNYKGTYSVCSSLSGVVTVNIRRLRDGQLVLPFTANISTIISHYIQKNDPRLKNGIVFMEEKGKVITLKSKGTCHFQFAMKQYVELTELSGYQRRDTTKEMSRLNILPN
ncbi:hypothetical protein Mgra_00002403 [Meloidogyne graminicola]|uniref:Uncharacterized protein n=1 Tax=Meloidogyne graminicola TaxID=189291 RepID=A0A8S9ZYU1_9BILA|nr:hypothetical protein Mgra_00002403 [Meloidogyne graminicola]